MPSLFRFPNPVNEVAARTVAAGVVALCVATLAWRTPWLLVPLAYGFVARVATTDESWGQVLLDSFLLLLSVGVHLAFWVTLTFAVIEWSRPEAERDRPLSEWSPDQLTTEVPWRSVGIGETVASGAVLAEIKDAKA